MQNWFHLNKEYHMTANHIVFPVILGKKESGKRSLLVSSVLFASHLTIDISGSSTWS